MNNERPIIGLTMGDPAGVGPELSLRALNATELASICRLAIFGDAVVLESCARAIGLSIPAIPRLAPSEFMNASLPASHMLVDHQQIGLADFTRCQVNSSCGKASFQYIQSAIDAALAGRVAAVTTGPINKEATHAAGITYPGHTEMFAERSADGPWCMMQYSPEVTCTFVTVHVGYAEVPKLLTQRSILDTIELTAAALQRLGGMSAPRLAVCGLNPHAGEHGLFGDGEEERLIIPAIKAARQQGITVEGPLPPDTAFLPAKRKQVDAIVCMYHDQGHIPLKALAFDSAVNTTLGLKIVRTSVDHGTAFDIAWTGAAKPDSLYAAIRLAVKLGG
ncbi:MAG: 4-hydroxythreonine-4-phosphate dehydrogenase PdxA [Pirellulaceae bacterium]